jgi:enterochelin esterase-like enzyme
MKRISQLLLGILMLAATAWGHSAPLGSPTQPMVNVGRIERLENFPSRFVEARPIDVWLPSDYSPMKRYAVISMQDGAGLFDAGQAWNRQAWKVHLALSRLMQDGKVQDAIVVGIPMVESTATASTTLTSTWPWPPRTCRRTTYPGGCDAKSSERPCRNPPSAPPSDQNRVPVL